MLAKLIVHGSDRDQAIRRMNRALKSFVILGATTNIGFLIDIMQHPSYILGDTTTNFIDIHFPEGWTSPTIDLSATMIAASAEHLGLHRNMVNVSSNSQGRTTSNDPFLQLSRRYP